MNSKKVGAVLSAFVLITATLALPFELTAVPQPVQASTLSQKQKELDALKKQQAQKEALAKQQATVKAKADAKIKELGGQISEVSNDIAQTQTDIANTSSNIEQKNQLIAGLESDLRRIKDQQDVLLRQMYIMRASMPDSLLIFADTPLSDREKEQAQFSALKRSVSALYLQTVATKEQIESSRSDLVRRNQELADLHDQQTAQKQGLASYQQTQASLKSNAEATLKQIDADLLKIRQQEAAAQAAIDAAVALALKNSSKGIYGTGPGVGNRVSRGTRIGSEGSTGFSTGYHVHQEVRVNGVPVNPQPYINNGTISWALHSFVVTQLFGHTSFSYVYPGGIHTGIDISAAAGSPVYAPADGTVILNSCPSGCGVGYGHAWAEQLDNGMIVLLGHLQ